MMLGLTDITERQVRVLGLDPAREPLAVKRRVGYLPDTVGFYDNLTAGDNLRYTARLIGLRPREREQAIARALERVGLADVADKRVGTFSRGMRQRLALAEILMKDAQIAILDEPTSGLDPQATAELLDIIRSLKQRRRRGAVVLASARARAERVRPRRAVQRRPHRADGHGGGARPPGARRRLRRRGRGRGRGLGRAAGARFRASAAVEQIGPASFASACRPRCAPGGGGRGRRRCTAALQASLGRGAEPRGDLHPLFPDQATPDEGARHAA